MVLPNFTYNNLIMYLVYGLVFIIMGLAIMLQRNKSSGILLAKNLRYLAAFGLLHGLAEWMYIFVPVRLYFFPHTALTPLLIVLFLLKVSSYLCLFYFGLLLYNETKKKLAWMQVYPPIAFVAWLGICLWVIVPDPSRLHGWTYAEIWSRYLLAFPASFITGYALMLQLPEFEQKGMPVAIKQNLFLLAHVMFFYSIFGGLVVPPAEFFPASVLNTELFKHYLLPIQKARSACGLLMAVLTIRVVDFYDLEARRLVEEAKRKQAILEERERFARDLHDGIIQSIYGEGLRLEHCLSTLTRDQTEQERELKQTIQRLNETIRDVRNYIADLRIPMGDSALDLLIQEIINEVSCRNITIAYEVGVHIPRLSREVTYNIILIFREALFNAIRHAQAENITIILDTRRDCLYLSIIDDGIGFSPCPSGIGHDGVQNMKKRAEAIHGSLSVTGYPHRGTEVLLLVPCNPEGGVYNANPNNDRR